MTAFCFQIHWRLALIDDVFEKRMVSIVSYSGSKATEERVSFKKRQEVGIMIAPGGGGGSCLNRCCYHCAWIWLALSWCPWFIWRITRANKSWEYESLAVNKFPLVWLFFSCVNICMLLNVRYLGAKLTWVTCSPPSVLSSLPENK